MLPNALKVQIERALFGVPLDDVMDRIRKTGRQVDEVSARLDRSMASIRKGLRALEHAAIDPRDGLYIVEDDCISCQVCTDLAPNTFKLRDDGVAFVHNPYGVELEKVRETIESCGGSCIKLA